MKKITFLLVALSFSICSLAQIIIKGTVSHDSILLESASVIIKNSNKGVATNEKGQFKLQAKKGDTISVSYLGYETIDVTVYKDEIFKIKLKENFQLEEVVINSAIKPKTSCSKTECVSRNRGCNSGCVCYCHGVPILVEYQEEIKEEIRFYPNPSSNGIFQLKLTEDYDEVKVSIANLSGQTIQNSTHQKFGGNLSIDLSQFSTGIYIINIVADGNSLKAIKAIRG